MLEQNFDDIRPYYNHEINGAVCRILEDPIFEVVAPFVYPDLSIMQIREKLFNVQSIEDFQMQIMHAAVKQIINKSIASFSYNGFEYLDKTKSYLFISNHRDILLDSALFELGLHELGFQTTEITFGSNLMKPDFVIEIGKSNKMFKVERGGSPRDFLKNSKYLSNYIRHTLLNKKVSIWIAQRNGRTKDGNDTTDQGILKMFCMSSHKNIIENLSELNIVPVSISYQWEPCDILKVREICLKQKENKYIKADNEDLNSILTGIKQFKGNVHVEVSQPITHNELMQFNKLEKNELYSSIAKLIDTRIHCSYKLSNNNFIAFDIENNSTCFLNNEYTLAERELFITKMEQNINQLDADINEVKPIYLGIYSNPVKNQISAKLSLKNNSIVD